MDFKNTPSVNGVNLVKTNDLAAVATSGSAADLASGTLPAGRLPAFGSGDVSFASGGGAGTIAANAVTNAKAAQMAANTIKGNNTGSTANAIDLTVSQMVTLLAGRIPTGANVPTSPAPVAGQFFLHTPTGRTVLLQYDGSAWRPMIAYGSMTLYVKGSGSNATDNGGSTGTAFATWQYAIDMIPPDVIGGSVLIYSADTGVTSYAEDVTIQGKNLTSGTIQLLGDNALNTLLSPTSSATGQIGATSTQGTVVFAASTFTQDQVQNCFIKGTTAANANNGVIRVVDTNTTTTVTVCGSWAVAPASGNTFTVFKPYSTIRSLTLGANQAGVTVQNLNLGGGSSTALTLQSGSVITLNYCVLSSTAYAVNGSGAGGLTANYCAFVTLASPAVAVTVLLVTCAGVAFLACRVDSQVSSSVSLTVYASGVSVVSWLGGNTIAVTGSSATAFYADSETLAAYGGTYTYNFHKNSTATPNSAVGVRALNGAHVQAAVGNSVFTGFTTTTSYDATSYSYIN